MTNYSVDKNYIVECFGRRIAEYHPNATVQVGTGNTSGDIVVVQPHIKMPDRDSITGALKNFGMLDQAYRATSVMVDYDDDKGVEFPDLIRQSQRGGEPQTQTEINRNCLKELIEIIRPLIVVACGPETMSLLSGRKIRSFERHAGKKFKVADLTTCTFYATLNPMDYGFARAPEYLKQQGKSEWTKLAEIYRVLKEKQEKERWS